MQIGENQNEAFQNNLERRQQRNKPDISGIISIGSGLTMNPSAANLANVTSGEYRAYIEKGKQNVKNKLHVLSNEQCASSGVLASCPKTPTSLERINNTTQNFYKKPNNDVNSIKCLEVLSKQVAAQIRQSKSRKGSRLNKIHSNGNQTYDTRWNSNQARIYWEEDKENEAYFRKMEAFRKDKRTRYEQAVYQKLKEQERENYKNNDFLSERERQREEIKRLAARRDENLSEDDSWQSAAGLEDYIIGKVIGQGAYAVVRIGLHKPSDKWVAIKIYEKSKLIEPQRRK